MRSTSCSNATISRSRQGSRPGRQRFEVLSAGSLKPAFPQWRRQPSFIPERLTNAVFPLLLDFQFDFGFSRFGEPQILCRARNIDHGRAPRFHPVVNDDDNILSH